MSNESIRMERQNERIRQVKRERICLAVILAAVVLIGGTITTILVRKPKFLVKTESLSMTQDEAVPKFKVSVTVKGSKKKVLDKKSGYTAGNLEKDLKSGVNYELACKADGKTDGKFKIRLKLSESLKKKLDKEWARKLKFTVEEGTLTVKNKYGAWDGDKFKKTNGEYAKNEFIPYQGERYYFGEDGKKVTKETQVGGKLYTFTKDGKVKSEKFYVDPSKPMIALTFDDGPGPDTEKLLATLEQYNSRATFFMVGSQVAKYPDTIKKMQKIGCELGNHTEEHKSLKKLSDQQIKATINSVSAKVAEATGGAQTTVTRPPYGAYDDHVKAAAPEPLIMWSIDTLDWKMKNVDSTIKSVNAATDGDIILMHDIHKTSIEAAIKLIPQLVEKGYQLVTVSEMAEARGVELENGGVYFSFYKQEQK